MYEGPVKMLGTLLWPYERDEIKGRWWAAIPGVRFAFAGGTLYAAFADYCAGEFQEVEDLPVLTLEQAVAFSMGMVKTTLAVAIARHRG